MPRKDKLPVATAILVLILGWPFTGSVRAQGRTAKAKSLRCTFPLNVTATWKREGPPAATLAPATLVLLFDSINTEEGTASLRNGSAGSDLIARLAGGYLHFI